MKTNIKTNFIYNSCYQILLMIMPLITTPYISRILGSEGIGRYSYAYSISYYFTMFAMLGVYNYGNRTMATIGDDIVERSKTFWSIYSIQITTSSIALVCYIIFIVFFFDEKVLGWILLLNIISSMFDINWLFFGMEMFKVTVIRNIVIKIISVVCIFIFVKDKNDIFTYSTILSLGTLISQLYLWTQIRKFIIKVKVNWHDIVPHIKPNIVLFIPIVAISLYKYMDKIMLGIMSTNSEVGYFESCEKIIQIPVAFINALGTVMLPRISSLLSQNKEKETEKYLGKSLMFAMFLVTSMSFGIMSVSGEFVPLFYGAGFEKCITLFQILLPSCWFLAVANVIRMQYLIPNKEDKIYIISVILGGIVNLTINMLLIPSMQSVGAAIGTLCAEATVCLIQYIYISKRISLSTYILKTVPFFIFGLLMYLFLYNIDIYVQSLLFTLLLKIMLGIIVYIMFSMLVIIYLKKKK